MPECFLLLFQEFQIQTASEWTRRWRIFPQHPLSEGKERSSHFEFVCWCWAQFSQLLSRWHPTPSNSRCSRCLWIWRDVAASQPAFIPLGIKFVCLGFIPAHSSLCLSGYIQREGHPPAHCTFLVPFISYIFLNLCAVVTFAERSIYKLSLHLWWMSSPWNPVRVWFVYVSYTTY